MNFKQIVAVGLVFIKFCDVMSQNKALGAILATKT